jgi:acyl-[acyl-carrier-protein]-phospholipid O-acyltransferase/long-chain-fatty-acid--[acyl-carrier-protein] ligase
MRELLDRDERFVGLLLPPSVAGVLANAATTLAGRVPVNLNFTLPEKTLNDCIAQCGIKHVLTGRRVMERLNYKLAAKVVYLEDLREKVRTRDKLAAAAGAFATPLPLLERLLGLHKIRGQDLLTIIFTSGSTGEPKGVMLSCDNIGSNISAMDQVSQLRRDDAFLGVLPLFHAFGFTCTVWAILVLDMRGVYHFNPLEAREVGAICRQEKVTFLIGTPTLLRHYLNRCDVADFASVEIVLSGAEPLPASLADEFESKFGVRPVEGYGATELSPLAAVNVPPSRAVDTARVTCREGTVGRPIPQVEAKLVGIDGQPNTGAEPLGMLWMRGPNVMQGYYGREDLTKQVICDGWYETGDVASIDAEGFITIAGRLSRFAKIGGEMIPHLKIEESLNDLLGGESDSLRFAVTSIPDARKGERLVVLHTALDVTPLELTRKLRDAGLPALWIPAADSFLSVDAIPVLGTNKLDLRQVNQLARAHFAAVAGSR